MNQLLHIYLAGIVVLVIAILINLLAQKLGIITWYGFLENITRHGFSQTIISKWPHLIFLLIIYPLILGAAAYYFIKILK